MIDQSDLIATDIQAYLKQHENKQLLRFLACGSVDDGKSTLIGRLLHDSKMIYEDQLASITADSVKHGTTGDRVDLALLVDGLQAEREQGITIDVAYRYFSTDKRKFIIADTPGHEQYTRNMATGASTCNLAVILIDARHGVLTQTRRHSYIASLLGIRHLIVAVNKMDLVDFDRERYESICSDYLNFAKQLESSDIRFVPISALDGDNVVNLSERTPWYDGQPLMEILETIEIEADKNFEDFRFPVQYVNRPHLDFRGFCGTVGSGVVRPGDPVMALPSRKTSTVKEIVTREGTLEEAFNGQAVALTLEDEIDISRGDVIVHADASVTVTNHLKAHLIWMSENAMQVDREYLFKFATKVTSGRVETIDHRIDVNTQELSEAEQLALNDIAVVNVVLTQHTVVDPYQKIVATGSFIVIDRLTNITVGAGMVDKPLGASDDDSVFKGRSEVEVALHGLLQRDLSPEEFERELRALVKAHYPHWEV